MPQDLSSSFSFILGKIVDEDGLLTGKEPGLGMEALPSLHTHCASSIKQRWLSMPWCLWTTGVTNSPHCFSTLVSLHLSRTPSVQYISSPVCTVGCSKVIDLPKSVAYSSLLLNHWLTLVEYGWKCVVHGLGPDIYHCFVLFTHLCLTSTSALRDFRNEILYIWTCRMSVHQHI